MTARAVFEALKAKGLLLATAESCTGGMIAAAITDIAGSSAVFDSSYVTYSNAAKSEMLDVHPDLIDEHGAVSPQVAEAMARGALAQGRADIAVSVTGVAGPDGGTPSKPVGLVYFCCMDWDGKTLTVKENFGPIGRDMVRIAARDRAFQLIIELLVDKTLN
jgi:nicotinamide-nucleotide amidase